MRTHPKSLLQAPSSQLQAAAKRKSDADAAAAAAAAAAGAGSSPPAADGPRGTLIVCPLSVLSNWQTQIEEHTAGNLQVRCCNPETCVYCRAAAQHSAVVPTVLSC
jgi:SWI/SNF-related matrix-associated actin-dependent regulator of chromatin subfamily A3